eukprot:gene8933-1855_t
MLTVAKIVFSVVLQHGMMIKPTSRNAIDRTLPAFYNGTWPADTDGCNCADNKGGCAAAAARETGGGQACLWFSQGCTIGCKVCTGVGSHTSVPLCADGMEPTNNEPRTRTMNKDAVAGSVNDTYRYNPWRAPGFAPVFDACGMAGGTPPGNAGPGEAVFSKTPWAEMGDKGSEVLKPGEVSAEWSAGTEVEVAWGIRYTATYVTEGTSPKGSAWAMSPIPRINAGPGFGMPAAKDGTCRNGAPTSDLACRQFKPTACQEDSAVPWHKLPGNTTRDGDVEGRCSGDWTGGVLVDTVDRAAHKKENAGFGSF